MAVSKRTFSINLYRICGGLLYRVLCSPRISWVRKIIRQIWGRFKCSHLIADISSSYAGWESITKVLLYACPICKVFFCWYLMLTAVRGKNNELSWTLPDLLSVSTCSFVLFSQCIFILYGYVVWMWFLYIVNMHCFYMRNLN